MKWLLQEKLSLASNAVLWRPSPGPGMGCLCEPSPARVMKLGQNRPCGPRRVARHWSAPQSWSLGRLRNGVPETQVVFSRPSRPRCRQHLPAQPSPPHPVSLGLPDRSDDDSSAAQSVCAEICSCTVLLGGRTLAGPWRQRQSEGRIGGTPWPGLVRGLEQPWAEAGTRAQVLITPQSSPWGQGFFPVLSTSLTHSEVL